jgi:uncharacterized repeat protein (TIGR01451 family)
LLWAGDTLQYEMKVRGHHYFREEHMKINPVQFNLLGKRNWVGLLVLLSVFGLVLTWQVALADGPAPNPLPSSKGVDARAPGPAAKIHGDAGKGRSLFAEYCSFCHGDLGSGGVNNPGSSDGTIPSLNPIDPGFLHSDQVAQAEDLAVGFAKEIDPFIQHGSQSAGGARVYSMPSFGDRNLLTQAQVADLEAYVMQANGVYWSDRYFPPGEVQMSGTRAGSTATYTITLVNHGGSPLADITLRDTFPPGLVPTKASIMGFDLRADPTDPADQGNNGQIIANNVQFVGTPNVPPGGTLGPFIIQAQIIDPRKPIPANVAEVQFSFTTADGITYSGGSAVSDPVVAQVEASEMADHYPPAPPSVSAGAKVYAANCAACHGDKGQGNGNATDFTDPGHARGDAPQEWYSTVAMGSLDMTMPYFIGQLSQADRWNAVFYARTFITTPDKIVAGKELYAKNCASCHGDKGDGKGSAAAMLRTPPSNFADARMMSTHASQELFDTLTQGKEKMPSYKNKLTDDQRWNLVDYLWTFVYAP